MKDTTQEAWVILKAGHPSWCYAQLPTEVAEMIGLKTEALVGASKPARMIAFLKRSSGVVRVISMAGSPELLSKEMARDRVLATALPSEKLVFNFPDALEQYLGLRTYASKAHPGQSRTKDSVAWVLRVDEYDRYRDATQEGGSFVMKPGEEMHVYFAKSQFMGILPQMAVMEGGPEATRETFLATPRARRRAAHEE